MAGVAYKMGHAPEIVLKRYEASKSNRMLFESLWQDIADVCIPRKNDIMHTNVPGERKGRSIFDSTAMTSLEQLAGALHGMLTSPTAYFFSLSTGNPDTDQIDDVRMWIQDTVRQMHDTMNNSNFQTEVHEYYIDLCAFGGGALSIEDDAADIVRFTSRPLKEIYVDENSKGIIDTVYRCFKWSPRDLVDEIGYKVLPEEIQKEYDDGKASEYEVVHAIYPRVYKEGKQPSKVIHTFVSQYILVAKEVLLSEEGFREFPMIYGRWSKVSGEKYGRGAGEKALPEALTVNKMTEVTLRGAQKVVDPPLQAPDDGFVMPLITRPGGLNYYRAGSNDRITPIFNDSRIDFGFQAIDSRTTKIREAFYTDQLKLREGPQMTAAEVQERSEQALRFLSPMLGRQQYEFLAPMVSRVYALMNRRGKFKPAPKQLAGKPLIIKFASVVAMAQRYSEMTSISRTFNALAPLAAIDPAVYDNIDTDKSFKIIAGLQNFPQEMIRRTTDVGNMRAQRQQQQQQQQQMMQEAHNSQVTSQAVGAAAKLKAKSA